MWDDIMWEDASNDNGRYGDPEVLHSQAGFYVGTMYRTANGFTCPGSRDSGYYPTRREAEDMLSIMQDMKMAA